MKIRNKVISGLVLSAVLTSGLFAMNGEMNKKDGDRKGCDFKKSMMHKKGEGHILGMFKDLNLTPEQESQIEKIVLESRKNLETPAVAFSKDGFDKGKYMEIMSEKRDNMLKSQAEVIEKSYAILTPKQKEQLKVLMELREEKMKQRFQDKMKG